MANYKPGGKEAGVSDHLERRHGVSIPPGRKGACPFCQHDTFSVRKDDSVGKCFHASCGRSVTAGGARDDYRGSLYEVLDRIKQACHEHLVKQAALTEGALGRGAWDYLIRHRGVHPQVLQDLAELGAVPKHYEVLEAFRPTAEDLRARQKDLEEKIAAAQAAWKEAGLRAQSEDEKRWGQQVAGLQRQRDQLKEECATLSERLSAAGGWVAFFHTDAHHRVRSIRFRKASAAEKKFQSYTPFHGSYGLFGHALFRPYREEEKQAGNRLMIVEGEINLLQIQSLAVRTAGGPGSEEGGAYANWVAATGSSSTVDEEAVAALLATPGAVRPLVVVQDHDDAGDAMVDRLSRGHTLEVVTPPRRGKDIDDVIRSFGPDAAAALREVQRLIAGRVLRCRPFDALAAQIYATRRKHGEDDDRREFEIHAAVKEVVVRDLAERGRFYREHGQGYYFLGDQKRLIPLDDSDRQLSCLLERYGLNASERAHAYVREALHVECLERGEPTRAHRLSWFNPDSFTLYLFNHGNRVYRVTADEIDLVDNGADGVLFVSDPRNEPFTLALEEDLGDLFHEHVAAQVNFADEGDTRLTRGQQQALLDLWFRSLFFGSILPTRPILAFVGPKGSGKSHTLRKIGVVLFGSQFQVKLMPDKEDAFDAVVTNSAYAAFDNADTNVRWLPDRLAVCATGGTVPKRVLYTTNTLADYPIACFLGITSRTPHFNRDDVADRLLINRVKRIGDGEGQGRPDAGRQRNGRAPPDDAGPEAAFLAESVLIAPLRKARDKILTSVVRQLQSVIKALKQTAGREYRTAFRMADFATFCLRIGDALGNRAAVEEMFARMSEEQSALTLDTERPVAVLLRWLEYEANRGREVSAQVLHEELKTVADGERLDYDCESGRALGQRLGHIEPNLRTVVRLTVRTDHHRKQKLYTFWPKEEEKRGKEADAGAGSPPPTPDGDGPPPEAAEDGPGLPAPTGAGGGGGCG
jgi:hypothetical protein